MRNQWWAAPGLAVAAVVLLAACGTSSPSSSNGSGGSGSSSTKSTAGSGSSGSSASTTSHMSATGLKTASTSKGTVLTTASGRTIYWFAIDTAGKSKCYGTCASYWPPVIGKPTAASGVSLMGSLGTIKRSNGQLQATYDGHPLYTYKGDTGSGQVNGNGINTSGGLWWAMTPSGAKLKAAKTGKKKKSGSSGGGGYGY
jgi:predicted lipoprotein with Yx(FWY)xxD motif